MLHRVRPQKPLNLDMADILAIEQPEGISVLLYGFNSLLFALDSLHPEGVSRQKEDSRDKLIKATDVDFIICHKKSI